MKIIIAGMLAGILVAGCASQGSKAYPGHLSIWPEAEVFTPCGGTEPLWLDYDTKTREPLAKQHWELQKEPYGTTYAVLEGAVGPQLDCGFCEEYKGSFKVLGVLEHRASTPNDCTP